jgi:coenzyme F420-0:L-glutamate ligase/coenzyme F420-1:gamma-L-glutamate ligase
MSLSLTPLQHILLIRRDDNLADIVVNALQKNNISLEDNDILVFAQKVISKAEGRTVNLSTVTPSQRAIELAKQTEKDPRVVELILQESNEILRIRVGAIIVEHRLGFVCANAGIDHSNVDSPLLSGEGSGVRLFVEDNYGYSSSLSHCRRNQL